ncbi:hypothetical protein [Microseira wollei]|uniref:Uncharacterized protein n=1 Tax=Microseira wollei NIES-4236 TaxID=2530354 RepID=A0AAV3X1U8_9CYAN|nr:hypothetical protein [Microseira wollei]GET36722.1 hypothetical protein MiSe_14740 [Microseira wollei NIES-4236]
MKPTIQNIDLLLGLNPLELTRYLRQTGWQEAEKLGEKAAIWKLNDSREREFEILLPLQPEIPGFALRIYEVIQTLEIVENRSSYQIIGDLVTEAPNIQIQGVITQIEIQNDRPIVTVMGCAVGKFRQIQLQLMPADLPLALKADRERLPVECTGDLIKQGERFVLNNIIDFGLYEEREKQLA